MILGREIRALHAMHNSRRWMTRMTRGRELSALDAMTTQGYVWHERI